MPLGKTIRIYLKDGAPTGIKIAEIVNRTIEATASSRNDLFELKHLPGYDKPGVYFLFGTDDKTGDPAVYMGEAENVYSRLKRHAIKKDFWEEVIYFTSKDENLTKAHVRYLESRLIEMARKSGRYEVVNTNKSKAASLPMADRDAMEEFLENIELLLGVLGHKVLVALPVKSDSTGSMIVEETMASYGDFHEEIFYLQTKGVAAMCMLVSEGVVVLEGSEVSENTADSMSEGFRQLREKLMERRILVPKGDKLEFTGDYLFSSPSAAAAIVAGNSINGRSAWKNKDGRTIREMERQWVKDRGD